MGEVLRIGTRRSALALAQANEVVASLRVHGFEATLVEIVTSGDRGEVSADRRGLKGLFVAEIVRALQEGRVDLAVHSAKDLPSEDPEGVVVAAVPPRQDPRDALVMRESELHPGDTVGTSSLRRRSQMKRLRPELALAPLRGNVDTRLRKVADGNLDAAVLAAAGLARLGLRPEHMAPLSTDEMMPAPGQGALAVHTRAGEEHPVSLLDDALSHLAYLAERRVMDLLGGGCALPFAAFANVGEDRYVELRAAVFELDGSNLVRAEAVSDDPEEAAELVYEGLLERGAADVLRKALE